MQTPWQPGAEALPRGQRQRLILRLLRLRSGRQLRRMLARVHPADIAPLFPLLKPDEQLELFEVLFELRLAAPTLRELDAENLRQVVEALPNSRLALIVGRLPADDAVDLLSELDSPRRDSLLESIDTALAARLNNLLLYGDTTAGGLMDPDVIFLRGEQTVAETLEVVRKLAESRRLFYLYVTDDRGHLIGLLKLWQLLTGRAEQPIREVMTREVISVRVDTPQQEVAQVFSRYDLPIMPVLDENGRLVGVITVDDVIDVIEEEASEDLYRLGGLSQPETLGSSIATSLRSRLPWLGVSLLGAGLAAWVILVFQGLIARYAVLVAFLHLVGATAGQTSRQTLTVMAAGLSTGEMELADAGRAVGKQAVVGLLNGLVTGALLAVAALVLERNALLAGIVFVAQLASQLLAATLASVAPLLLSRLGQDPTLGTSTALVATSDILGFLCFLGLASALAEHLPA